jgi:hypothetical protein
VCPICLQPSTSRSSTPLRCLQMLEARLMGNYPPFLSFFPLIEIDHRVSRTSPQSDNPILTSRKPPSS